MQIQVYWLYGGNTVVQVPNCIIAATYTYTLCDNSNMCPDIVPQHTLHLTGHLASCRAAL